MPAPSPAASPDPALRALLRRADPAGPLPDADATFLAAVHARLRAAPGPPPTLRTWAAALARELNPLAAALALLAALGLGGSLAYAEHQRDRTARYADAYARSVDPWLMHLHSAGDPPATPHS
jgi:hypothetical protein